MERRVAAGMDPDALWGLGSQALAGVSLEDADEDDDTFEDEAGGTAAAAGTGVGGVLEEDSVAGMRMEDFGGASMGVEDLGSGGVPLGGGAGEAPEEFLPEGAVSNKEASPKPSRTLSTAAVS